MDSLTQDQPETKHCLNCGTILTGKYCSSCGQRDIPKRQTLGELLINFLGSFTSFESKFFTTFYYLLLKPGHLAREYNEGKRERYYHPARAYVFTSFIFFLVIFWGEDSDTNASFTIDRDGVKTPIVWDQDSINNAIKFDTLLEYSSRREYDSLQSLLPEEDRDGFLRRFIQYRSIDINLKYKGRGNELVKDLWNTFTNNFPKVFFLLLPIFALILKLLFIRHDYFYSEHLVFTTVYYNFFFVSASIAMLLTNVFWLVWLGVIFYLWIPVHFILAMKKMYGQSWSKTLLKGFIFSIILMACIMVGLILNLFETMLQV
jgi:hypothetical protein